jgi:hypothetical protein
MAMPEGRSTVTMAGTVVDEGGRVWEGCSCAPVAAAADHVLAQCAGLVRRVNANAMTAPSRVLPGGTLGKHVRHMVDHFAAAAELGCRGAASGVEGNGQGECVDYDHRARNVPMESDPGIALDVIEQVRGRIREASRASLDAPVRIRMMLSGAGDRAEMVSSVGRELAFATHHAIHHQAMLRAIAAEQGVELDADFGKAPGTLHHERHAEATLRQ